MSNVKISKPKATNKGGNQWQKRKHEKNHQKEKQQKEKQLKEKLREEKLLTEKNRRENQLEENLLERKAWAAVKVWELDLQVLARPFRFCLGCKTSKGFPFEVFFIPKMLRKWGFGKAAAQIFFTGASDHCVCTRRKRR